MHTNVVGLLHAITMMLHTYYVAGYKPTGRTCKRIQATFDILVANGLPSDTKLLLGQYTRGRFVVRNGAFTTVLTADFNGTRARTYKGDGTSRMYQYDFDLQIPTKEELVEQDECKVFSDLYRELSKKMIELNLDDIT